MLRLARELSRFKRDERGVFAVLFAVMAIVLIATAGAVVDFTAIQQARTRAQLALDSAALGLQPTIYTAGVTAATLQPKAQLLVDERLAGSPVSATVGVPTVDTTEGSLRLAADVVVPMTFVQLVGVRTVSARVIAEATRKRLNLEVAMVLDNSGSMNQQSRMTNLKKASLCAMNILYNGIADCADATITAANSVAPAGENVKIGIVPFTAFVNIGPGYRNAAWMDSSGLSEIANDNFDNDDDDSNAYTLQVQRFALYDALTNVDWAGCVEARQYPYDTNDTTPNAAIPATLFVPTFAPDEPDSGYGNSYLPDRPNACVNKDLGEWTWVQNKFVCSESGHTQTRYNRASCTEAQTTNAYTQKDSNGVTVTAQQTQPSSLYGNNANCTTTYQMVSSSTSGWTTTYQNRRTISCTFQFSDRELQERICKYTGAVDLTKVGPNGDCPTNPMTPLTGTKATVKTAIDAMSPQGYTNIHQGVIWGFHMLSPTEPLIEARPYGTATSKVMIVMTDGENTVQGYSSSNMNRATGYMAYGYPGPTYNGRLYSTAFPSPASGGQVTSAMDSRTVEACASAKAQGIVIYTIGLNAPNQTTINMLRSCATSNSHAYFPTQSSELVSTFQAIAQQLSNLRLAR